MSDSPSARSSFDSTASLAYEDMSFPDEEPPTASSLGMGYMRAALDELERLQPPGPPLSAHSLAYLKGSDVEDYLGREEDLELEQEHPLDPVLDQFAWGPSPVDDASFELETESSDGCCLHDVLDEVHASFLEPIRKDSGQWVPCDVHESHYRARPHLVPHDRALHVPPPHAQPQFSNPFPASPRDGRSRAEDIMHALGTGTSASFPHMRPPTIRVSPAPSGPFSDATNHASAGVRRSRTVSEYKFASLAQREMRYKEPLLSPPPPPVPPKDDVPRHLLTRAEHANLSSTLAAGNHVRDSRRLRAAASSPSLSLAQPPPDPASRKNKGKKLQKPRPKPSALQIFAPFESGALPSLSTGNLLSTIAEAFSTPITFHRVPSRRSPSGKYH